MWGKKYQFLWGILLITATSSISWSQRTTNLRKAALAPESLETIIQKLGYKNKEQALEEYQMFMERIRGGFATEEWYEECRKNRNPKLCISVQNYLEADKKEEAAQKKNKDSGHSSKRYRLRITNSNLLQKEDYQQQVRRFDTFPRDTLIRFAKAALKSTACPRNLSLTLAYELEEHLDVPGTWEYVDKLYTHGISCLKKTDPWNEFVLVHYALFHVAKKNYEKAIGLLKMALESETLREDYRSYYWLWKMHRELGKKEEALNYAQIIINKFPRSWYAINVFKAQGQDPFDYFRNKSDLLDQYETKDEMANLHGYWVKFGLQAAEDPYMLRRYIDKFIRRLPNNIEEGYALHMARLFDAAKQHRFQIFLLTRVFSENSNTMNEEVLKLLHPISYLEEFNEYSEVLDSAILMGLARQESSLDANAESPARAKGLLQILVPTAARIDRHKSRDLFNPKNNISIGTKYLTKLVERFDGSFEKALAGYNAGPSRMESWEDDYGWTKDIEIMLDLIPYRETRDYVPSILRNAFWYHNLHEEEINKGKKDKFQTAELLKPLVSSIDVRTPSNEKK